MKSVQNSAILLLFFSQLTWAEMYCSTSKLEPKLNQFQKTWQFKDIILGCSHANDLNNLKYKLSELLIIRGHLDEIDRDDFNVIDHASGYSLVKKLNDYSINDNNHLNFIQLNEFRSIKPYENNQTKANPMTTQLVNQVDPSLWLNNIVTLSSWSRRSGEPGNVSAANWIATQFTTMDYQVSQPSFNAGATSTNNIMAIKMGQLRPDDWYVIGGHMDAIPSNNAYGAIDNASGCAAVIEMARIASKYSFEGTLIFLCYSGEEQGLYGSQFHVNTLINEQNNNKVKAALTLDMVGYTSNDDHELLLESSSKYQTLMNEMAQQAAIYTPELSVYTSTNYFGSDHVPYINNGMPGILSIDDDWAVYPDYHQSSDLPENVNTTQGEFIIKVNLATLNVKAVAIGAFDLIFAHNFE